MCISCGVKNVIKNTTQIIPKELLYILAETSLNRIVANIFSVKWQQVYTQVFFIRIEYIHFYCRWTKVIKIDKEANRVL